MRHRLKLYHRDPIIGTTWFNVACALAALLFLLLILFTSPAAAHCDCESPPVASADARIAGPYVSPEYVPTRHRRRHDCAPPAPAIEYAWPRRGLPADAQR